MKAQEDDLIQMIDAEYRPAPSTLPTSQSLQAAIHRRVKTRRAVRLVAVGVTAIALVLGLRAIPDDVGQTTEPLVASPPSIAAPLELPDELEAGFVEADRLPDPWDRNWNEGIQGQDLDSMLAGNEMIELEESWEKPIEFGGELAMIDEMMNDDHEKETL